MYQYQLLTSSSRPSPGGSRVNRNSNMEGSTVAARNERFNLFCRAIVAIVNSHRLTSQIYNHIREKMGEYLQKIESLTDEVALQQSGSSYDNLHMTRVLQTESGEQIFLPTTDFDYNIIFKKLLLAVNEADVAAGNSETEKRRSTPYFGVLQSSENPGYAKVRISQRGRQYLTDKQCDYLFEDINSEGFLSNIALKRRSLEQLPELTTSGPAFSNFLPIEQGYSYDFVYALPVDGWPEEATEWISRDRPADWPSGQLVSRIVEGIVYIVFLSNFGYSAFK